MMTGTQPTNGVHSSAIVALPAGPRSVPFTEMVHSANATILRPVSLRGSIIDDVVIVRYERVPSTRQEPHRDDASSKRAAAAVSRSSSVPLSSRSAAATFSSSCATL